MAKKGGKSTSKSKTSTKKRMTAREREELLIENFVGLQKAMTNLSIKFNKLADNIASLLHIFELSAKNFIQNSPSSPEDKDLLKKIDSLLEQNKTIAKGLVIIENKLRERTSSAPTDQFHKPDSNQF